MSPSLRTPQKREHRDKSGKRPLDQATGRPEIQSFDADSADAVSERIEVPVEVEVFTSLAPI